MVVAQRIVQSLFPLSGTRVLLTPRVTLIGGVAPPQRVGARGVPEGKPHLRRHHRAARWAGDGGQGAVACCWSSPKGTPTKGECDF